MDRYLIAGLGNPDGQYRGTRHNIGFQVLDRLADRYGIRLSEEKFDADFASGRIRGETAYLLRPTTYMNRSGDAVGPAARYHEIDPDHVVVIHDDVDLDLGRLNVKIGGGHGGHNGLQSVEQKLGSREFLRVRCGVGRPEHGSVRDHVLGSFDDDERRVVERVVEGACDAVETIVLDGPNEAQNQHNGRDFS